MQYLKLNILSSIIAITNVLLFMTIIDVDARLGAPPSPSPLQQQRRRRETTNTVDDNETMMMSYNVNDNGCIGYADGDTDDKCQQANELGLFDGLTYRYSLECTEGLGYACCESSERYQSNVQNLGQCERQQQQSDPYQVNNNGCIGYADGDTDAKCQQANELGLFDGGTYRFSLQCTEGHGYACCQSPERFQSNVYNLGQCERMNISYDTENDFSEDEDENENEDATTTATTIPAPPSDSYYPSSAPSDSYYPSSAPSDSYYPSSAPSESYYPSSAPSESYYPSSAPSDDTPPPSSSPSPSSSSSSSSSSSISEFPTNASIGDLPVPVLPTLSPSPSPLTIVPTTSSPSSSPTILSNSPSDSPSSSPSSSPSDSPSSSPSNSPSDSPSSYPSSSPSDSPSSYPSSSPSDSPSSSPSSSPSDSPSSPPTGAPAMTTSTDTPTRTTVYDIIQI